MVKLVFDRIEQLIKEFHESFFTNSKFFHQICLRIRIYKKNAKINIYFYQKVKKLRGKNNYK